MNEDHLDPDIHLWPPEEPEWVPIVKANVEAIFKEFGADNWGQVYRSIYKHTPCGPTLGVVIYGCDNTLYNDDLYKLDDETPVLKLHVSSIVEGVEQGTNTEVVDLKVKGALKRLYKAVDDVNTEANEIWDETHGCPTCQKHFGNTRLEFSPVWKECPECKGLGDVL